MIKTIATSVLATFIAGTAFAQEQSLLIKGIVKDDQGETLPYATITIHNPTDSIMISGVASQEDGSFELAVPAEQYLLQISFFGMDSKWMRLSQSAGTIELGTVKLETGGGDRLNDVVVVGYRDQMSLHIDKRVYNVGSDLSAQGGNATDMLQNIPSVSVDPEGNVSLRGSQAVRILIDGKISGFASSADALQQLQSDMIERVEIITNASARYEAEGEAGIINIILKKNVKRGFNGTATVRGGFYPDDGLGINANYRKNKLNLYGSANYNYRRVVGRSSTHQRLENADTAFIYEQGYKHVRKKNSVSVNAGMDYSIDTKNSLSFSLGYRQGLGRNEYDRSYDNSRINGDFVSRDERFEDQTEKENMIEATLGYSRKFNREGAEWKTSARWMHDKDFEDSDYDEYSSIAPDYIIERSNAHITQQLVLLQSDFIWPIKTTARLEAGVRAQVRDFDNKFGYSRLVNENWVANPRYNDRFNYEEQVYAAYLQGGNTYGKLGMQMGLRAEYSEVYTRQYSQAGDNSRSYLNFFPSLSLSYQQNKQQTYQLSYSRRIRRPGQWDLMPFMKFGDNRTMRVGNPNLDPELTDSYEAGMLNTWVKGSLLSSVYYRHTKDKFERISSAGADGVIYQTAMNIATRDAIGLELNANYSPTNKVRLSTGFNFFREEINGKLDNATFSYDNFSWSNRSSIGLFLPQRWRMQLSGNYEAPTVTAQGKRLSVYFMDFGMSKDIMKRKATIAFNVSDIFNSRKWRSTVNTPEIQSETMFQWRQRSARITFTYRFNQVARDNEQNDLIDKGTEMEE